MKTNFPTINESEMLQQATSDPWHSLAIITEWERNHQTFVLLLPLVYENTYTAITMSGDNPCPVFSQYQVGELVWVSSKATPAGPLNFV